MLAPDLAREVARIVYRGDDLPSPVKVTLTEAGHKLWSVYYSEYDYREACTCCWNLSDMDKRWLDLAAEASSEA